jgi:hypothetical protein
MLFRQRVALVGDGFDQQAFRIDPWEVELLGKADNPLGRGPLQPGVWYVGAFPVPIDAARVCPPPPDEAVSDPRTEQCYQFLRRGNDFVCQARWAAGERFQVADLDSD